MEGIADALGSAKPPRGPSLDSIEELVKECQAIVANMQSVANDRVNRLVGSQPEQTSDDACPPNGLFHQLSFLRTELMRLNSIIIRL